MKKLILIVALIFGVQSTALAQLSIGTSEIRQDGKRAGLIFVEQSGEEERQTVEHWVLFSNYLFPGIDNPDVVTKIKYLPNRDDDLASFIARTTSRKGYRYFTVIPIESDELPPGVAGNIGSNQFADDSESHWIHKVGGWNFIIERY